MTPHRKDGWGSVECRIAKNLMLMYSRERCGDEDPLVYSLDVTDGDDMLRLASKWVRLGCTEFAYVRLLENTLPGFFSRNPKSHKKQTVNRVRHMFYEKDENGKNVVGVISKEHPSNSDEQKEVWPESVDLYKKYKLKNQ